MKYAIQVRGNSTRIGGRYAASQAGNGGFGFRGSLTDALLFDSVGDAVEAIARRYSWVASNTDIFPLDELTIVGVREVSNPRLEAVEL